MTEIAIVRHYMPDAEAQDTLVRGLLARLTQAEKGNPDAEDIGAMCNESQADEGLEVTLE